MRSKSKSIVRRRKRDSGGGRGVPNEVVRMTVEILELLRMGRIITGARRGVLDGHSEMSTIFIGEPPLLQGVEGGFASPKIRLP